MAGFLRYRDKNNNVYFKKLVDPSNKKILAVSPEGQAILRGNNQIIDGEVDASIASDKHPVIRRMAGDHSGGDTIDDLIAQAQEYLSTSADARSNNYDEVNARQTNRVAKQLGRFSEIDDQFIQAGVPHNKIDALLDTRPLQNNVPAPWVDKESKPGLTRRVHTTYDVNPYTGEQEIVPYYEPEKVRGRTVASNRPLVTEFGDSREQAIEGLGSARNDKATEYVQKRILQLMGTAPEEANRVDQYGVDFRAKGEGIDGQIRKEDEPYRAQLFTALYPENKTYSNNNPREIINDVEDMVSSEMRKGDRSLLRAIDSLMQQGKLENNWDYGAIGKVIKEDYDKTLTPVLTREEALENHRAWDKISIAPQSVEMWDLKGIHDKVKASKGNDIGPQDVGYSWSNGNNRDGRLRARMNINMPDDSPFKTDVVKEHPMVQQILSTLPYS